MPIYEREGRFRVTAFADGRQVERSIRGTREQAEELERKLQAELSSEVHTHGDAAIVWLGGPSRSYVYFVQSGKNGPVKIGRTTNAKIRLSAMQTGNPEPLYLLCAIPGGKTLERLLHRTLRKHRLNGEWFRFADEVKELVSELQACASVGLAVENSG